MDTLPGQWPYILLCLVQSVFHMLSSIILNSAPPLHRSVPVWVVYSVIILPEET